MGNSNSGSKNNTITVVQAAGKFKYATKRNKERKKGVEDQIKRYMDNHYRKKSNILDQVTRSSTTACSTEDALTSSTGGSPSGQTTQIMKYIRRHKVSGVSSDFNICDTRGAWNALRVQCTDQRQANSAVSGSHFRKLSNALRFIRRIDMNPVISTLAIQYDSTEALDPWDTQCSLCDTTPKGALCTKVYHRDCLEKRGFLSNDLERETVELANTEIGWSCPSCESLFWLLSDAEKIDLMETFDEMDTNHDSLINREEYLEYHRKRYKELTETEIPSGRCQQENAIFDSMDRDGSEVIDWWEFMTPMCIKILMKKNKNQLVQMLVPREIHKIRRYFQAYDPNGSGAISTKDSRMALRQWYISLINRPAFRIPLVDWFEGYKTDQQDMINLVTNKVSWVEFLSRCAIFILAARPNTGSARPFIPRLDDVPEEDHTGINCMTTRF